MTAVFALIGVVLVAALGLVLAGRLPPVPQPTAGPRSPQLPEHPSASDVDQLRLPVVFRGYRMQDVDAALAVLRNRISQLEAGAPFTGDVTETTSTIIHDPAPDS